MAGIAAMVLTGILGTAMGLSNTAAFMASAVAFVGVSLWTDGRISRRRRMAAQVLPPESPPKIQKTPETQKTLEAPETPGSTGAVAGSAADRPRDAGQPKRGPGGTEGRRAS